MTPAPTPDQLLSSMPHAVALGIELDEAMPQRARGRLAWAPERCTAGGVLHGGALMALADTVGAICAFLNLPPDAGTATIESKTNFFRGLRGGTLHASAHPLHVGRTLVVVQTELADDDGRAVGLTTQTQAVLPASGP
jgi:uncharacterized protein (TIGR00369 family)